MKTNKLFRVICVVIFVVLVALIISSVIINTIIETATNFNSEPISHAGFMRNLEKHPKIKIFLLENIDDVKACDFQLFYNESFSKNPDRDIKGYKITGYFEENKSGDRIQVTCSRGSLLLGTTAATSWDNKADELIAKGSTTIRANGYNYDFYCFNSHLLNKESIVALFKETLSEK